MTEKVSKDVAEEMLKNILDELSINEAFTGDDEQSKKKLINAIMAGRLEFVDGVFKQTLMSPVVMGEKKITEIEIYEPDGTQLREASTVKGSDDIGKSMAILGAVTGLGLPVMNKLKTRDLMLGVGVMSLFL